MDILPSTHWISRHITTLPVTCFPVSASQRLTPDALIAARYDLTTTRGCATVWEYV